MAKYIPQTGFEEYRGDFFEAVLAEIERSGLDVLFTRNQHARIFTSKPIPTVKRTEIQAMMRDRFMQLECMWHAMTPVQRMRMRDYATELNKTDTRNLPPMQRFRSLGLQWRLDQFIREKLYPQYKLEIIEETAEELSFKITLDTKLLDEFIVSPLRNVH